MKRTPKIVYLEDGQKAKLIEKITPKKYLIKPLLQVCDRFGDHILEGPEQIVKKIYEYLPLKLYDEEIKNRTSELKALDKEISEKRKELNKINKDVNKIERLEKELKSVKATIKVIKDLELL